MIKWICVVFIEFIRGVPLITLLFVANVVLGYFLPPGSNFDLILRVIIMITMFSAAYIAEVIRGGLAALPKGQYEAAAVLGLIMRKHASDHSAASVEDFHSGDRERGGGSVQGYDAGVGHFDVRSGRHDPWPDPRSTEWNGVYWELWLAASCSSSFATAFHNTHSGWSVSSQLVIDKKEV